MFVRSFFPTVSRHIGVQRATLCGSDSTILLKPLGKGILHKDANIQRSVKSQHILYSSVPNSNNKNQVGNVTQAVVDPRESNTLTRAQKLKKAVADYGTTVIVFHVGISLISLGSCYLLVSTGLDVNQVLVNLGLNDWIKENTMLVSNAGTFAVAYAIHKVFAPVRISITLASVPFLVRYLRQKGILKK